MYPTLNWITAYVYRMTETTNLYSSMHPSVVQGQINHFNFDLKRKAHWEVTEYSRTHVESNWEEEQPLKKRVHQKRISLSTVSKLSVY